jgi:hypothetical protein
VKKEHKSRYVLSLIKETVTMLDASATMRPNKAFQLTASREILRFRIMEMSVPGGGKVGFGFCGIDRVSKS